MKLLVLDMQTSGYANIFVVATEIKTPGELIPSSAASSVTAVSCHLDVFAAFSRHLREPRETESRVDCANLVVAEVVSHGER